MRRPLALLAFLLAALLAVPAAGQDAGEGLDDLMAAEVAETSAAPDWTGDVDGVQATNYVCQTYLYTPSTPDGTFRVAFKGCVAKASNSAARFGSFTVAFALGNGAYASGNIYWTSPSGYPATGRHLYRSPDNLLLAGTKSKGSCLGCHVDSARSIGFVTSVDPAVYGHSFRLIVRLPNGQLYGPIRTTSFGCYIHQTC